jgi:hypothetical protein
MYIPICMYVYVYTYDSKPVYIYKYICICIYICIYIYIYICIYNGYLYVIILHYHHMYLIFNIYLPFFQLKELLYALGRRNLLKKIMRKKFEMKNLFQIISKINENKNLQIHLKTPNFFFSNNEFSKKELSLLEVSVLCGSKYGVQYLLTYGGGWLFHNGFDDEENIYGILNNSENDKYISKNYDNENTRIENIDDNNDCDNDDNDDDNDDDETNNYDNDGIMYKKFNYMVNFSGNILHAAVVGNRVSSLIYILKWLSDINDNYAHVYDGYYDNDSNYDDNHVDNEISANNNYNDVTNNSKNDNNNDINPDPYTYPKDLLDFLLKGVNKEGETPLQLAEKLNRIDIKRELIKYMKL